MLRLLLLSLLIYSTLSYTKLVRSSISNNNNNNINRRTLLNKTLKPSPPSSSPPQNEDKTKYFIAIGVFILAACFDKFVYHADPAHDDALYKSTVTKVIKE